MSDEFKTTLDSIVESTKNLAKIAGEKMEEIALNLGDKSTELWDCAKIKVEIEKLEYSTIKQYRILGELYYKSTFGELVDLTPVIAKINSNIELINKLKNGEPVNSEDIEEATEVTAEEIL